MTMSILCTIKYMNRSYFSKARYMIGVGFKILGRTPVPKLAPSYTPPPEQSTARRKQIHVQPIICGKKTHNLLPVSKTLSVDHSLRRKVPFMDAVSR